MQLVDSYLNEVGRFLPAAQREDIIKELREAITEQIEDLAQARSGAPGSGDEEAVLRRFGHPLKVASAYQSQRHLIGPDYYPAFVQTLKTLLIVVGSVNLVIWLIIAASQGWSTSVGGLIERVLWMAFWITAITTASFVFIERSGERLGWYESWKPASLRPSTLGTIDRSDVVTNLIVEGVFLLWWNDVLPFKNLIPALGESYPMSLSSEWALFFWPINALVLGWFVLHAWVLARGLWQRETLRGEIILGLSALAMIAMLLHSGASVSGPVDPRLFQSLQLSVASILVFIGFIIAWDTYKAYRMLRDPGPE